MKDYVYEWMPDVPVDPNPRTPLKALVPNLDRRTERWGPCYDKLVNVTGFPPSQIERFSAFDYKNYSSVADAKAHAAEHFNGLTPFLAQKYRNDISGFCWSFTWQALIKHVASKSSTQYYLVIIDDCMVHMPYNQIRQSLDAFGNSKIVHLSRNPRRLLCRPIFDEFDIWQYGLCGRTDTGYVINSEGASDIFEVSNAHLYPVSAHVFEHLALYGNQAGYYSLSAKYERLGGGGLGAAQIFLGGIELQDRVSSTGYK